jgi:hypothetical protein
LLSFGSELISLAFASNRVSKLPSTNIPATHKLL